MLPATNGEDLHDGLIYIKLYIKFHIKTVALNHFINNRLQQLEKSQLFRFSQAILL